jgi:hypothetical protein
MARSWLNPLNTSIYIWESQCWSTAISAWAAARTERAISTFSRPVDSDDPPLVQIAHDAGAKADLILQNGVIEIATTLSGFFADAKTRLA